MTRDYARHRKSPKKPAGKRPRRRTPARKPEKRSAFNAPSFSAGVIFGAGLILLASYAPGVFQESINAVRIELEPPAEEIVFEFQEMLEQDTVVTDPSDYPAEFLDSDPSAPPREYLVQAASLRASEAAAALREQLMAQGLPANYEKVVISSGTWYRVTVGPFPTEVEANRALTRLREQKLTPRLIKLG